MPVTLESKHNAVLRDVSWDFYLRTLAEVSSGTRVIYDRGRMEIVAPISLEHSSDKSLIARLLERFCEERDIAITSAGDLTLKREDALRGLEPDEAFFVLAEPPPPGTSEMDLSLFEGPDLAIEVEISNSAIDKEPLYAELGVVELWRWNGRDLRIRALRADRRGYDDSARSVLLPTLPVDRLLEHIRMGRRLHQHAVIKSWVREIRSSSSGEAGKGSHQA